jgi:hypothetical protein
MVLANNIVAVITNQDSTGQPDGGRADHPCTAHQRRRGSGQAQVAGSHQVQVAHRGSAP